MANEEQLSILRQGVEVWNKWRTEPGEDEMEFAQTNPLEAFVLSTILRHEKLRAANLSGANLERMKLRGVNLYGADLRGANLRDAELQTANLSSCLLTKANIYGADLTKADLRFGMLDEANLFAANLRRANISDALLSDANLYGADLREAKLIKTNLSGANLEESNLCRSNLHEANLFRANLVKAKLVGANLTGANLSGVNFTRADLTDAYLVEADLSSANFINTNVTNARLYKSRIYGTSTWDLIGEFKIQKDLVITPDSVSSITVDNVEIAQFIYLILNNKKLRDVMNALTSKTVLILGRFALPERKVILDALREKLREYDLLPIVFDFDRPADKDFTETIKTLAGISYFVIADITNPKSSPLELQATVPDYQIPFVPIIQEGESPFAMMVDLQKKYPWVLPTRSYDSIETLMSALKPGIIDPAVEMRNKLRLVKAQEQVTESLRDYVDKSL